MCKWRWMRSGLAINVTSLLWWLSHYSSVTGVHRGDEGGQITRCIPCLGVTDHLHLSTWRADSKLQQNFHLLPSFSFLLTLSCFPPSFRQFLQTQSLRLTFYTLNMFWDCSHILNTLSHYHFNTLHTWSIVLNYWVSVAMQYTVLCKCWMNSATSLCFIS